MAEGGLQEQGPERTGPVVVVTFEEDGTVDTRSNMSAFVVADRRLRNRDQSIQVGGSGASLRTLLEGLSGNDEAFVKKTSGAGPDSRDGSAEAGRRRVRTNSQGARAAHESLKKSLELRFEPSMFDPAQELVTSERIKASMSGQLTLRLLLEHLATKP